MKVLLALLLIMSFGCLKFEAPSDGAGSGPVVNSPQSDSSGKVLSTHGLHKFLPNIVDTRSEANIILDNTNGRDLRGVHLNLRDAEGNTYYSGSALGIQNIAKRGPLKLGVGAVLVEQLRGENKKYTTTHEIVDGYLNIDIY